VPDLTNREKLIIARLAAGEYAQRHTCRAIWQNKLRHSRDPDCPYRAFMECQMARSIDYDKREPHQIRLLQLHPNPFGPGPPPLPRPEPPDDFPRIPKGYDPSAG